MSLFPALTQLSGGSCPLTQKLGCQCQAVISPEAELFWLPGCGECHVASDTQMPFLKLAGAASRAHLVLGIYLM